MALPHLLDTLRSEGATGPERGRWLFLQGSDFQRGRSFVPLSRLDCLVEDSSNARARIGKQLNVYEAYNGSVRVPGDKGFLPARAFAQKEARVTQPAIVSNKMLGTVLAQIKERQDVVNQAKSGRFG